MKEIKLIIRQGPDGKLICTAEGTDLHALLGNGAALAIGNFGELCLYTAQQWKKVAEYISRMHPDDTRILRPFMSSARRVEWEGEGILLSPKHAQYANIEDSALMTEGEDGIWRVRGRAE